ncbi:MAG: CoA-binding protein [Bacteroidia bacterium]
MKKTLVIGVSARHERFANMAVRNLIAHGHHVEAIGLQKGHCCGIEIKTGKPKIDDVDTVTVYVGPRNQDMYIDYVLKEIQPRRIIFNPGTENPSFEDRAIEQGIEVEEACTLVLLSRRVY